VSVEIRVPRLAESISEAVLAEWLKPDGAAVRRDEPIATLETDKAAVEIAAEENGMLRHVAKAGDKVVVGQAIARIEPGQDGAGRSAPTRAKETAPRTTPAPAPATPAPAASVAPPATPAPAARPGAESPPLSPSVRRLVEEHGLDPGEVAATGPGGRLLKEDVLRAIESAPARESSAPPEPSPARAPSPVAAAAGPTPAIEPGEERAVPMSRIRQRIAERLVQSQHTAAILTTFNEIDMTAVLEMRARHGETFEKKHGVRLGFMSPFARASILALAEFPELNAEIRGTHIVYRSHVHLGIAVSTPRGLVVPVVRRADALDFAGLEKEIARLAERGRAGTLTPEELSGGTFTISNGGIYGSLLSTPILNPPQSGILGMHKIEKRPIAAGDQVVIRPMMYVALSYDHRIVDGQQAVSFLVRVKERLEDPERMLLGV
jgi:2-oxoglutarate dehydrogenase E2 component (dihydrolipoamide succinyltransferase)